MSRNAKIHSVNIFRFLIFSVYIPFFERSASLKLNMKLCEAIPGTLYVVSEEDAAMNENTE